jgi:DNA-binding NtrC family response regulator
VKAPLRFHDTVEQFRRGLVVVTLEATGGNRTRAAEALGLSRTFLLRLIQKYRINFPRAPRGGRREA